MQILATPVRVRLGLTTLVLTVMQLMATAVADTRSQHQPQQPDARTFVEQMLLADLTDAQLGRLAVKQASSADVKAFGQTIADDHAAANEELAVMAAQMRVAVPTQLDEEHRRVVSRLGGLRNSEFDRAYLDTTVQRHREALSMLRSRASDGRSGKGDRADDDRLLDQWAAKMLPIVERHLRRAEDLQHRLSTR